jgi:PAS domain S-box-containing protein
MDDDATLAAVVRATQHLVVIADPGGAVLWVNTAFERTTGHAQADLPGLDLSDLLLGPGTDTAVRQRLLDALHTGQAVGDVELASPRRDGSVCWVELELLPLRDETGHLTRWVALLQDITSWKLEQERHALNERLLNDAMEIAQVGAWDIDAMSREVRWSDQTYALHDLTPGSREVDLRRGLDFYKPTSRERVSEAVQRALSSGTPFDLELELVTASGRERWVRVTGNSLMIEGRVVRVAGIVQDITERHAAREQIAELAERLRLAAEVAGIGVWEAPLDDVSQAVWNDQMYAMYGLAPRSVPLSAELWYSMVHPDDRPIAQRIGAELTAHPDAAYDQEFRIVRADGEVRHVRSLGRRVVSGGRPKIIGTNFDITEQKRAAQAQMEKEAAERASRAKSEFLSRVSHELRTPLNGVLGFAQLLEGDAGAMTPTQRLQLQHLRHAGNHLLQLVNDMLDLASIEAGALRMSLEPVALAELVSEVAALVQADAHKRGVTLELPAPPPTPLCVQADRTRLRQVVSNLLSNAIKYNREHGRVIVLWERQDDAVTLHISDTGAGLSPQARQQLFQPFNRLGAEASTVEGTGLGLAITRHLVQAMGGRIDVQTTAGVGSRFSITLPAAPVPCQPAPRPRLSPEEAALPVPAARCVLYVEDNPVNVMVMQQALALQNPGCRLEIAPDGEQALAWLAHERPDLVLLDINLPGIDGYEVLRGLRALPHLAGLPCVAVSADAMPEELARAQAAGFDAYWTKPLDLSGLAERIDRLVHRASLAASPPSGTMPGGAGSTPGLRPP